jgi:hypothetical protein
VTQHRTATDIAIGCQVASPAAIAGAGSRVETPKALHVPADVLMEVPRSVARSDAESRENSKGDSRVYRNLAYIRSSQRPRMVGLALTVAVAVMAR